MEPVSSMPHSQGHSHNPYPEPKQPNSSYWYLSLRSIVILSPIYASSQHKFTIPGLPYDKHLNFNSEVCEMTYSTILHNTVIVISCLFIT